MELSVCAIENYLSISLGEESWLSLCKNHNGTYEVAVDFDKFHMSMMENSSMHSVLISTVFNYSDYLTAIGWSFAFKVGARIIYIHSPTSLSHFTDRSDFAHTIAISLIANEMYDSWLSGNSDIPIVILSRYFIKGAFSPFTERYFLREVLHSSLEYSASYAAVIEGIYYVDINKDLKAKLIKKMLKAKPGCPLRVMAYKKGWQSLSMRYSISNEEEYNLFLSEFCTATIHNNEDLRNLFIAINYAGNSDMYHDDSTLIKYMRTEGYSDSDIESTIKLLNYEMQVE